MMMYLIFRFIKARSMERDCQLARYRTAISCPGTGGASSVPPSSRFTSSATSLGSDMHDVCVQSSTRSPEASTGRTRSLLREGLPASSASAAASTSGVLR